MSGQVLDIFIYLTFIIKVHSEIYWLLLQSNNAYIFPGFGLGLIISGATRVHDDMLLAACKFASYKSSICYCIKTMFIIFIYWTAEALAAQVTQEHIEKGLIYPPFANIRKISACIAAKVAAKAYELGKIIPYLSKIKTS